MRERVWSSVLSLVAIACLLFPAVLFAADASAAIAVDPNNAAASAAPTNSGASAGPGSVVNPSLVDLLVKKGILTTTEANSLRNMSGSAGMEQLLMLLKAKGVVNDTEAAELKSATADADTMHSLVDTESGPLTSASLVTGQAMQTKPPEKAPGPTVIPAIAPVRVLTLDPPEKDALKPALTLGAVRVLPYGFIKSTMAYDSYNPTGDDFPRPGFSAADSGPNSNPEFHIKARATRFGSRFEWPDVSKNIIVTGQVEADFEGNFSRADNRNVSSIRSNALQLRLAYGRIDWNTMPNTDIFFEAGQDWTIFGSSALMNLLETTFFGAYWGNLYERSPQFRFGVVQKFGGSRNWKLSPEIALMMPSEGNLPADAVNSACTTTVDKVTLAATTTCANTVVRNWSPGSYYNSSWIRLRAWFPRRFSGAGFTPSARQQFWRPLYPPPSRLCFPEELTPPAPDMEIRLGCRSLRGGLPWLPAVTTEPTCASFSEAKPCPTTTRHWV